MAHPHDPATFRMARLRDEQDLLAMMVDFNRIEGIPWRPDTVATALRQLLTEPVLGRVGVIEVAGSISGYYVLTFGFDLEFGGRDAFLTELYIAPAKRGCGLGRALLSEAERQARQAGVHAIHLGVLPDDERARALYRSAGFEESPFVFLTKSIGGEPASASPPSCSSAMPRR